jgi:hypothetical protein
MSYIGVTGFKREQELAYAQEEAEALFKLDYTAALGFVSSNKRVADPVSEGSSALFHAFRQRTRT